MELLSGFGRNVESPGTPVTNMSETLLSYRNISRNATINKLPAIVKSIQINSISFPDPLPRSVIETNEKFVIAETSQC